MILPDEQEPEEYHSIVIFIDLFVHDRPDDRELDEDDEKKISLLHSETDDEKDDSEEKKDEEDVKKEEEVVLTVFKCRNSGCPMPGFETDIESEACCICDTPRPPMSELIAQHKAELAAQKAAEKAAAAMDGAEEEEEGEPLHHIRMKML